VYGVEMSLTPLAGLASIGGDAKLPANTAAQAATLFVLAVEVKFTRRERSGNGNSGVKHPAGRGAVIRSSVLRCVRIP